MPGDSILFYIFGAVMVVASLFVIGQRSPIYSVLLLIVSFAALAGLYVLLGAPFLAVIQIIIYAGAIMVLFLFVVMLLNAPYEQPVTADDAGAGLPALSGAEGKPGAPTAAGGTGVSAAATGIAGVTVRRRLARGPRRLGAALGIVLLVELAWGLWRGGAAQEIQAAAAAERAGAASSVREIGRVLFSEYGFAFEVTSVLILIAMVGAVVLAKREI